MKMARSSTTPVDWMRDEQVIIIKEAIPDLDDDDSSEDLFGDSKATLKPRTGKKKTGKKTTRKKSTRKRS